MYKLQHFFFNSTLLSKISNHFLVMSFIGNDTETFILIIAGVWYLYNKLIHMVYSFLNLVLPVQKQAAE